MDLASGVPCSSGPVGGKLRVQLRLGLGRVEYPDLAGHPGGVADVAVAIGRVERRGAVSLVRTQKAVDLGDVDPAEQVWVVRCVGPAVRGAAAYPLVHGTDVGHGRGGVVGGAESGHCQEVAGALEPTPGVAAVAGVARDPGHGERVHRLQQQRPQPAHEHRRVAVHLPDGSILGEPPGTGSVMDAGPPGRSLRPRDALEHHGAQP